MDCICPEQLKKSEKKKRLQGMMHIVSMEFNARPDTG